MDISSNQPDWVYGVLMDVGLVNDDGMPADTNLVISETAFASGESSVQTSFGGGIVGLGEIEGVSEQAKQIIGLAQPLVSITKPANNQELPGSGRVYFYLLTTSGVKFYSCNLKEIYGQKHLFSEIFTRFTLIKRQADEIMAKHSKELDSSWGR